MRAASSILSRTRSSCWSRFLSTANNTSSTIVQGEEAAVARLGPSDGCIVLNVGGKEFHTLRSTVMSNPVLAQHVQLAEQNASHMTSNGAVFIDRDPAQFNYILQFLRNNTEQMDDAVVAASSTSMMSLKSLQKTKQMFRKVLVAGKLKGIQLPKDSQACKDLFLEAAYYDIPELRSAICSNSMVARFFSLFSNNPLGSATMWFGRLRAGLLATGAIGGSMFVSVEENVDWLFRRVGLNVNTKAFLGGSGEGAAKKE